MAIAIPALVTAQINALLVHLRPRTDGVTSQRLPPVTPAMTRNRLADLLEILTGLCASGTLAGDSIHTAADATNNIAVAAVCTDQATANTLLNAMRDGTGEAGGGIAAHFLIVGAAEHIGADITNAITAAAAINIGTSITLANDLKAEFNGHMALNAATGHWGPDEANVITSPDATDLASVVVLANELRADYNAHCANVNAGSTVSAVDNAAITGVNSLIGATVTFTGNVTAALAGLSRVILTSTVNMIRWDAANPLPAAPAVLDQFTVDYTTVDDVITQLRQGKAIADQGHDPYGSMASFADAAHRLLTQLGAAVPAYLTPAAAKEQFGPFNPQGGVTGSMGHGASAYSADMLDLVRDAVAAWTIPT